MRPVTVDTQYFRDRSDVVGSCWEWRGALSQNGYGSMRTKGVTYPAHRKSFESAHGKIQCGLHICHKCDNRKCVNPDHLFAGTRKDNMQDCIAKGRFKTPFGSGENCPRAILTEEDVLSIRKDIRSDSALGLIYGVAKSTISAVKKRKTWVKI